MSNQRAFTRKKNGGVYVRWYLSILVGVMRWPLGVGPLGVDPGGAAGCRSGGRRSGPDRFLASPRCARQKQASVGVASLLELASVDPTAL